MWDLISKFIGALLTTLTGVVFVKYILNRNLKDKKFFNIFLVFLITLIISFPNLLNYLFFRTLISCFLYMILFKSVFNISYYISIVASFAHMLFLTFSEIIVFLLLTKLFNVDFNFLYNVFAGSIFSNIVICLISMFLALILKKWLLIIINIKIKNYFILYLILLFLCIIIFFYITFSNIGNGIGLFSGLTVIFILLIVIISLLIQAYRNNELTIKYDKLLEFIKKYEVEIDNQRTMRHEIKNQLLTIKSKIIDKDKNSNIINYIDEILEDNSKVINHTEYAKLNYLPPNGIKGLFYFKVSEAFDKNIDVNINISREIEKSVLSNLNSVMFNQVGKLFGILLDNAIEAAEIANDKKIGIEIYLINNEVNFIVSNTYVGDVLSSRGIFPITTKGESRGHGLLLARAIIGSSNKFKLETTITDELYIQKLIIK